MSTQSYDLQNAQPPLVNLPLAVITVGEMGAVSATLDGIEAHLQFMPNVGAEHSSESYWTHSLNSAVARYVLRCGKVTEAFSLRSFTRGAAALRQTTWGHRQHQNQILVGHDEAALHDSSKSPVADSFRERTFLSRFQ